MDREATNAQAAEMRRPRRGLVKSLLLLAGLIVVVLAIYYAVILVLLATAHST